MQVHMGWSLFKQLQPTCQTPASHSSSLPSSCWLTTRHKRMQWTSCCAVGAVDEPCTLRPMALKGANTPWAQTSCICTQWTSACALLQLATCSGSTPQRPPFCVPMGADMLPPAEVTSLHLHMCTCSCSDNRDRDLVGRNLPETELTSTHGVCSTYAPCQRMTLFFTKRRR